MDDSRGSTDQSWTATNRRYRETTPQNPTMGRKAIWKDTLTRWACGRSGSRDGSSGWKRREQRPEQENWKLLDGLSVRGSGR